MPVVVAFGDSNTWGFSPGGGARMARDVRWPGVTARSLGQSFQAIEQGPAAAPPRSTIRRKTGVTASPISRDA
jgi:lysophospholipase L1-like esterase